MQKGRSLGSRLLECLTASPRRRLPVSTASPESLKVLQCPPSRVMMRLLLGITITWAACQFASYGDCHRNRQSGLRFMPLNFGRIMSM